MTEADFEIIKNLYISHVNRNNRLAKSNTYPRDFITGLIDENNNWFSRLKAEYYSNLVDTKTMLLIYRELTSEEKEKYGKDRDLIGFFNYFDEEIPLFFDDYGQQEYTVYDGVEISGGAYSSRFDTFLCITDQIDSIKSYKIIKEN